MIQQACDRERDPSNDRAAMRELELRLSAATNQAPANSTNRNPSSASGRPV